MKITTRGYWVSKTYRWVSLVYWFSYSVYFRTITYFSAANPKIYLGGMLDDRKSDIYEQVPVQYLPLTSLYIPTDATIVEDILAKFSFPLIAKPNVGFRGYLVRKVDNIEELKDVITAFTGKELLIQEYLSEAHEYSIMYYYHTTVDQGISSLVEKHLPTIMGDGKRTIRELISDMDNPFLNEEWVLQKNKSNLSNVLPIGTSYMVDHVGNYARGSKFENLNNEIDGALMCSIQQFFKHVPGMHFCRLDLKANSLAALKNGEFKLLEINGAKSEPLHIYDPRMSFGSVLSAIREHWTILFRIVRSNIDSVDIPSSMEGIKSYYALKKLVS